MVMLERLSFIDIALTRREVPTLRMGLLFLRFLESLSAGVLIGESAELSNLPDPITASSGSGRLLDLMDPVDVVDSSSAAQEALRLVTFRRIHEVAQFCALKPLWLFMFLCGCFVSFFLTAPELVRVGSVVREALPSTIC